MSHDIDLIKKALIIVGTIALMSGVWMAFSFGKAMSIAHGLTLALLSIVVAVMPTIIDYLHKAGRKPVAGILTAFAVLFTGAEYFSHLGYTIGNRVENTEQTGIQNTKYADTRDSVTENKSNLAMWKTQLAKLNEANAWAATTKAEGLRSSLATADEAIRQEEANGGCGPKCLKLKRDKDTIEARIATVEQAADLAKRIEATQRLVEGARAKAEVTEYRSSPIVNQTKFVGQLWTASLDPGSEALNWTQIAIGALIALVTTFLAPLAWFMAFADQSSAPRTTSFVRGKTPSQPMTPTVPAVETRTINAVPPVEQRFSAPAIQHRLDTLTVHDLISGTA